MPGISTILPSLVLAKAVDFDAIADTLAHDERADAAPEAAERREPPLRRSDEPA